MIFKDDLGLFLDKYISILLRICFLLSLLFIDIQFVNAQNQDSLQQLKEITVVGFQRQLMFYPTQILQKQNLENLNAFSVADALRFFSGVQIKDYGGIGGLKTVDVRNMGTQQTGVFYNGIQISNAQNGSIDLGKFSLDNLEQIAVTAGQNAEIFKSARAFSLASMIELQSKTPVFQGQKKSNLKAAFKTGSFGLVNPSVLWEQKINTKMANTFNAEYLEANGKYTFRLKGADYDTLLTRKNADIKSLRLENDFQYQIQPKRKLVIHSYYYQSERGLPGAIVSNKFATEGQRLWDRNLFFQSKYEDESFKNLKYQIIAKFAIDKNIYEDDFWPSASGVLRNQYLQKEAYLSGTLAYHISKKWDISLANDLSYNTLDANLYRFLYPKRWTNLSVLATQLQMGDWNFQGDVLYYALKDYTNQSEIQKNIHRYLPSIAINWQPRNVKGLSINGFYKQTFRMPNFNELYYTLIGNTLLHPEQVNAYDIGFNYIYFTNHSFNKLKWSSHIFYNQVKDKIIAIPAANLFRWTMINLDKVEIKGFTSDVEYDTHITDIQLQMALNYTFQDARDRTANSTVFGQLIPYAPLHSGSLRWNANKNNWNFNYAFIYTGKRYNQKSNTPDNEMQPWYTHDVGINKDFLYRKMKYKAGVELNNILNQNFEVVSNYPMPGRNFKFFIHANF